MKKFILAALATSVAASPVLAAPYQDWNNQDRGGQIYNQSHGDHRFGQWDQGSRLQYRNWQQGQRFDSRYAYNYRVISNPGFYRLHDAPRGYRWVQSGSDAVLIGLTSGIVAAVMANMIR
jgi:Ni/Co efflux regulator RcnB